MLVSVNTICVFFRSDDKTSTSVSYRSRLLKISLVWSLESRASQGKISGSNPSHDVLVILAGVLQCGLHWPLHVSGLKNKFRLVQAVTGQ